MLTPQQHKIYQFIQHYIASHNYAPTLREIGAAVNITSRGVVHGHVKALITAGLLSATENSKRNLHLTKKRLGSTLRIPLLGKIAAGKPIEAISQHEVINLNEIFGQNDRFLLQVRGDSMIEEGIFDGDYVLCERAVQVPNGTIVIALINQQEVTLKKFYKTHQSITLKPANSKMKPQIFSPEQVMIQGRYLGLLRIN